MLDKQWYIVSEVTVKMRQNVTNNCYKFKYCKIKCQLERIPINYLHQTHHLKKHDGYLTLMQQRLHLCYEWIFSSPASNRPLKPGTGQHIKGQWLHFIQKQNKAVIIFSHSLYHFRIMCLRSQFQWHDWFHKYCTFPLGH